MPGMGLAPTTEVRFQSPTPPTVDTPAHKHKTNAHTHTHESLTQSSWHVTLAGNDPYPCEGSYYPYNVRAEPVTFPHQLSSLNQTYGWGCESGDSYGNSGTSFDSGSSTNQPNTADVWKVYSAVGTNTNNGGIDASSSKLSFIGSVGVNGGQGNSDCIYGSCSDHNTYGVSGSGWQGPGNGEVRRETGT